MKRKEFVELAGGVWESPVHYDKWGEQEKQANFWDFYAGFQEEARSLYAGVAVSGLIERKEYSIEHIIPNGTLRRHMHRYRREVRNGASVNPFNLAPCHRDLNNKRRDMSFDFDEDTIVETHCIDLPDARVCVVGVDHEDEWVVPVSTRGDVARAILYMCLVYDLDKLFAANVDTLLAWAEQDPPEVWEVHYNRWVKARLGIWNPLISNQPHRLPRKLLRDWELMRGLRP